MRMKKGNTQNREILSLIISPSPPSFPSHSRPPFLLSLFLRPLLSRLSLYSLRIACNIFAPCVRRCQKLRRSKWVRAGDGRREGERECRPFFFVSFLLFFLFCLLVFFSFPPLPSLSFLFISCLSFIFLSFLVVPSFFFPSLAAGKPRRPGGPMEVTEAYRKLGFTVRE